ncbi:hypothetical protein V6O07_05665, partial [Arthrospira platensis SPKY2]
QEVARNAARQGDWPTVERTMHQARAMSRDNPWLQDMTAELDQLARIRDEARFSKEAIYSSRRARSRLASKVESPAYRQDAVPDFLRRKRSQGKADQPGGES